ncbi:hypothetical protein HELRODRAFT_160457 [Helobdella robusta]|uniref:REKLES domain-containing protein n=1 Tax=Helobdella robusta TaxID=6412 RepID=T1EQ98_HELRO|nr:hypothetical protein HELRODRAFT_160457 [Helobdella robusta]ESO06294.1 hypothetical protein HELRODRAFT_160457 [Helobdella robusta]
MWNCINFHSVPPTYQSKHMKPSPTDLMNHHTHLRLPPPHQPINVLHPSLLNLSPFFFPPPNPSSHANNHHSHPNDPVSLATRAMAEMTKRMEDASRLVNAVTNKKIAEQLNTPIGMPFKALKRENPFTSDSNSTHGKSEDTSPLPSKQVSLGTGSQKQTQTDQSQRSSPICMAGVNIKLTNKHEDGKKHDSMEVSIELNGTQYKGFLYPQYQQQHQQNNHQQQHNQQQHHQQQSNFRQSDLNDQQHKQHQPDHAQQQNIMKLMNNNIFFPNTPQHYLQQQQQLSLPGMQRYPPAVQHKQSSPSPTLQTNDDDDNEINSHNMKDTNNNNNNTAENNNILDDNFFTDDYINKNNSNNNNNNKNVMNDISNKE